MCLNWISVWGGLKPFFWYRYNICLCCWHIWAEAKEKRGKKASPRNANYNLFHPTVESIASIYIYIDAILIYIYIYIDIMLAGSSYTYILLYIYRLKERNDSFMSSAHTHTCANRKPNKLLSKISPPFHRYRYHSFFQAMFVSTVSTWKMPSCLHWQHDAV